MGDLRQESVARERALTEALRWMFQVIDDYGSTPVPTQGSTDLAAQETEWFCFGCSERFYSAWPEWIEPTDATFPHAKDCHYIAARKLLAAVPPEPTREGT